MAIVSVEEARKSIGIEGAEQNPVLERVIARAQATIENITDRKLERQTGFAEALEAAGGILYPRRTPIEAITSLTLGGQAVTGYVVETDKISLEGALNGFRGRYKRRLYRVEYTGGYIFAGPGATLPVDIAEIALELVAFFWNWRGESPDSFLSKGRDARAFIRSLKQGIPRVCFDRLRPYVRQKARYYDV